MKRRIVRSLSAVFAALAATSPALGLPPMWTVEAPGAHLILFGSLHLLPSGLAWTPPALAEALARGDEVWFEIPVDPETQARGAARLLERGVLPKDDDLFRRLSPDQAARLRRVGAKEGVSAKSLSRMQPWLADVTLSLVQDVRAGADPSQGVEQQIQSMSPTTASRRSFETVDEQIDLLAGAPEPDQLASLESTLGEISDDPTAYSRILVEWMAGDTAALERDALAPMMAASPAGYRRLVTDRNRRWADRLTQRLSGAGEVVVVVGVGHLIGPGGVPALLRARGFQVTGP